MTEKTCGVDFLAGFFVGALAGAAAAILLAPQSGEDTRLYIREKGVELKGQAEDLGLEARKRAEELQSQAKGKAEKVQVKVKEAIHEGKTAASVKTEELLATLDSSKSPESAPIEE